MPIAKLGIITLILFWLKNIHKKKTIISATCIIEANC